VLTHKLATRRNVSLPTGDTLEDTFRLIQEQASRLAIGSSSAEASDEGPSTPAAEPIGPTKGFTFLEASDLTPEEHLQQCSSTQAEQPTCDLTDMSSGSATVSTGKSLATWDSKNGVSYLLWERDGRAYMAQLGITKIGKGDVFIDCSQAIDVLLGAVPARSPAAEDMKHIRKLLNDYLMLSDLGWMSPDELPPAILKLSKGRISAQVNISGHTDHLSREWLTPVSTKAS